MSWSPRRSRGHVVMSAVFRLHVRGCATYSGWVPGRLGVRGAAAGVVCVVCCPGFTYAAGATYSEAGARAVWSLGR
jgi:hypothetical protein